MISVPSERVMCLRHDIRCADDIRFAYEGTDIISYLCLQKYIIRRKPYIISRKQYIIQQSVYNVMKNGDVYVRKQIA